MNKCFTFLITLFVALMVTTALAETDYMASEWVDAIKNGEVGKSYGKDGVIKTLRTSGLPMTSYGIGAPEGGITAVEYGDGLNHQTVLTIVDLSLAITNGGFDAGSKVYTFPEGRILIEGVVVSLISSITANFSASTNDLFVLGMGTTTTSVNANGTLSGTEVSLIPSTSNDTVGGTVTAFANGVALAASAQFDGTTTAVAAFINMGIPAANDSGANTNQLAGSVITLTWKSLGDY